MKKLILIRHGKSSWEMPIEDHERPLSAKGIRNSNTIFDKLASVLPKRFLVWSSTAKRAYDTSLIFSETINIPSELTITKPELYTFDYKNLFSIIKKCDDAIPSLIIFGHNNAITDFVNKFGNKYIENVPTSGVVMIDFDNDKWQDIQTGIITNTLFPKDFSNAN